MEYTTEQIQECKAYLGYCVKNGGIGEDVVQDLIDRKDWSEVYDMMEYGEYLADSERKGE